MLRKVVDIVMCVACRAVGLYVPNPVIMFMAELHDWDAIHARRGAEVGVATPFLVVT